MWQAELLLRPAAPLSIDISCPPGAQQQTRRSSMPRATDGTPYRYIDPATHYAGSVNNNKLLHCWQPQAASLPLPCN